MPIRDGRIRNAAIDAATVGHPIAAAIVKAAAEAALTRAGLPLAEAAAGAHDIVANPPAKVATQAAEVARAVDSMPGGKSPLASLGIWNAIVTIILGVLASYGIATDWIDPNQAATFGLSAYMVVTGAIGFYARWRARRPIGK